MEHRSGGPVEIAEIIQIKLINVSNVLWSRKDHAAVTIIPGKPQLQRIIKLVICHQVAHAVPVYVGAIH